MYETQTIASAVAKVPRSTENGCVTTEHADSDHIHGSFAFNYDPQQLAAYYCEWSCTYDEDVNREHYTGPTYMAHYLTRFAAWEGVGVDISNKDLNIIDAGCGTGLVGVALHAEGYRRIDGFDLCHEMVKKAEEPGVYRTLTGGCNLMEPIPHYRDNQYEVCVCCGVFTVGHVPPTSLAELVRITQPGGLVLASTRKSYYETTEFKPLYEQLIAQGAITLIDYVMDGPYLEEEGAHYWAFQVL